MLNVTSAQKSSPEYVKNTYSCMPKCAMVSLVALPIILGALAFIHLKGGKSFGFLDPLLDKMGTRGAYIATIAPIVCILILLGIKLCKTRKHQEKLKPENLPIDFKEKHSLYTSGGSQLNPRIKSHMDRKEKILKLLAPLWGLAEGEVTYFHPGTCSSAVTSCFSACYRENNILNIIGYGTGYTCPDIPTHIRSNFRDFNTTLLGIHIERKKQELKARNSRAAETFLDNTFIDQNLVLRFKKYYQTVSTSTEVLVEFFHKDEIISGNPNVLLNNDLYI